HVADASNPAAGDQIAAVYDVLEELGIEAKDTILVLNKVDAAEPRNLNGLLVRYPNALAISARSGTGLPQLAGAVSDAISRGFVDVDVETGVENGRLQAFLAAHGEVLSKSYQDSRVVIHCRIAENHLGRIREEATAIRPRLNGQSNNGQSANGHAENVHVDNGPPHPSKNGHVRRKIPPR
ncbi:MAG TPA: hypothetical protein VGY55_03115, partial [Pirellulales bacterium]|nr:hypothetical protein [Pirellulales bacterium]